MRKSAFRKAGLALAALSIGVMGAVTTVPASAATTNYDKNCGRAASGWVDVFDGQVTAGWAAQDGPNSPSARIALTVTNNTTGTTYPRVNLLPSNFRPDVGNTAYNVPTSAIAGGSITPGHLYTINAFTVHYFDGLPVEEVRYEGGRVSSCRVPLGNSGRSFVG